MLVIEHQRSHDDGEKKEELFSREKEIEKMPYLERGRVGLEVQEGWQLCLMPEVLPAVDFA